MAERRTARAAILVEQNRDLLLAEIELPAELGPGQVLVDVRYAGICGSQLGEIDGAKGPDRFLPHLLGHEGSGTVVEVGTGVRHVGVGDHVVLHWRKGVGIDSVPPTYRWQGRELNAGWVTTFNERAAVSENRVTPIPESFPGDLAVLLGCPVTTGLGVVSNDAGLTLGESLVVLGAGGVGLAVVQGAALVSAHPIIAVDRAAGSLALAERLGATATVAAGVDRTELAGSIRELVGSEGADVVVETTGAAELISLAYELTNSQGRCVLVGVPHADRPATIHTLDLHLGKRLLGSHGGSTRPERDIPRYVALYEAGKLDLAALVTDRFAFEDVNEAIARLRAGEIAGRCVLDFAGRSTQRRTVDAEVSG